jgi:hypothetical protein
MMQAVNNQELLFIRETDITTVSERSIKPFLEVLNRVKDVRKEKIKQ